jgi:AFG3 family protein
MRRLLKIMLFCVITVVVLLGVATLINTPSTNPITFQRFSEQMLKNHDVDHVTAYKSGDLLNVEVFLKKESLTKPEYRDAKKADKDFSLSEDGSSTPQYFFQAATFDGLSKQISDTETSFGYTDAEKISVGIEAAHESLLSNWLVQCIIMLFFILCGFLGYREGKKRTIGATAGLLLGVFPAPFGLIIVYLSERIPPEKNGGIRV